MAKSVMFTGRNLLLNYLDLFKNIICLNRFQNGFGATLKANSLLLRVAPNAEDCKLGATIIRIILLEVVSIRFKRICEQQRPRFALTSRKLNVVFPGIFKINRKCFNMTVQLPT